MSDNRVRVPLNGKMVRLDQLAAEVGADLSVSDTEVVVTDEDSTVTAAGLSAALDSHAPDSTWGTATEDKALDAARTKAADVLSGKATFTAAEMQQILAAAVLCATR